MRRKEREVTDFDRIRTIMESCEICRVGFYDGEEVYIVPMNFGFEMTKEKTVLYFHGASEGRKVDLIRQNVDAGFEMDAHYQLMAGKEACSYSAEYQSIIGNGTISMVEDVQEKKKALSFLMEHTTHQSGWEFTDLHVHTVSVYRLDVRKLSCKQNG